MGETGWSALRLLDDLARQSRRWGHGAAASIQGARQAELRAQGEALRGLLLGPQPSGAGGAHDGR